MGEVVYVGLVAIIASVITFVVLNIYGYFHHRFLRRKRRG